MAAVATIDRIRVTLPVQHWRLLRACCGSLPEDPGAQKLVRDRGCVHGMLGLGYVPGDTVTKRRPKKQFTQRTLMGSGIVLGPAGRPYVLAEGTDIHDGPCIQCGSMSGGRKPCGPHEGMFGHIRCAACRAHGQCLVCDYADTVVGTAVGTTIESGGLGAKPHTGPLHPHPFATPVLQYVQATVEATPPGTHLLVVARHQEVLGLLKLACAHHRVGVWMLDAGSPEDVAACIQWTKTRKCYSSHSVVLALTRPAVPSCLLREIRHCIMVAPVALSVVEHLSQHEGGPGGPCGSGCPKSLTWITVEPDPVAAAGPDPVVSGLSSGPGRLPVNPSMG